MSEPSFWERPDVVAHFAAREPDRRLAAWLGQWSARRPDARVRALDLGCAGGRNSLLLAELGHEVWAIDSSAAMVEATRERLAPLLGASQARRRVVLGRMDDLGAFHDGAFDLVVALGVLQNAERREEWERALSEVSRVLAPGGSCLVANFAPDSRPAGQALQPVPGEADVFQGFGGAHARLTLLSATALDAAFRLHGLHPAGASEAVRVPTERGHRTTVNALYHKPD